MVTAATSLGDWKHVYNQAVIKLLMLTSHTQPDSLPSSATEAQLFYQSRAWEMLTWPNASSLHCTLINKKGLSC